MKSEFDKIADTQERIEQLEKRIKELEGQKTCKELLEGNVYNEEFLIAFHEMLEKFVNEYDNMASMTAIQQASALLDTFNE
jgi:hypothetical protein